MACWYVQYPGAAPVGPIDAAELRAAWGRQAAPAGTMVAAEGTSQWVPFHSVAELVGAAPVVATAGVCGPPRKRNAAVRAAGVTAVIGVAVLLIGGGAYWLFVASTIEFERAQTHD